ncbi:MAG TPA: lactate racemase domain-containing protein [Methylomirabilota bacterium]|nr:lactate racemase domain-containing protein [Methylomirabilota bacterium]
MKVELPYGETTITAALPDRTRTLSNTETAAPPAVADLESAVRDALAGPLGLPRLRELARPGSSVTIAFDDATVASYGPIRGVAIKAMLEELDAAGVSRRRVTLVCANALHRKLRPVELARIIGPELVDEFGPRLLCHDAEDPTALVDLGPTPEHGHPVEVSRLVADSDLTVYVNARYHRGFNGGWKSVCVGLSTYRSIRVTHTPDGMSMSVHQNRMHEVLDEMGRHLERRLGRRVFKLDTLLSDPYHVAKVVAGGVTETRREILGTVERMFPPRRDLAREQFDVLVYGVPDASPYAIFSHMNPILTLISSGLGYLGGLIEAAGRPGCTVIMATPVPERWDRVAHPSYPEVWERVLARTRDPYEIMGRHADEYAGRGDYIEAYRARFGFHPVHAIMAVYPLKRLARVGRVIVAGPRDPAVPRHVGFESAASVEDAVARAEQIHGPACSIAHIQQPVPARPPAAPGGDRW